MSPEQQDRKDLFLGLIAWFKSQEVQPAAVAEVLMEVMVAIIFSTPPEARAAGIAALFADLGTRIMVGVEGMKDDKD